MSSQSDSNSDLSTSESETSVRPGVKNKEGMTHLEQVTCAILALGKRHGSSRNEIAEYLVNNYQMEPKISKALVAKALYKGLDDGIIKRPSGSTRYQVCDPPRRPRYQSTTRQGRGAGQGSGKRQGDGRTDSRRRQQRRR